MRQMHLTVVSYHTIVVALCDLFMSLLAQLDEKYDAQPPQSYSIRQGEKHLQFREFPVGDWQGNLFAVSLLVWFHWSQV